MLDFRLQVFYSVAKRLNFTKASTELFISQPAVTKHIKELESEYKVSLFERSGNKKIHLTAAGEIMLRYTEHLLKTYRDLASDMALLNHKSSGLLRIGASTTIAQYIIPPILAEFHQKFRDIKVLLVTGNTEDIESALSNKDIEMGIIEGISRNPLIKYEKYLQDELVLVSSTTNTLIKKDQIKPSELKDYPLLLREPGSGTLDVIAHALKPHHLKLADLQIEMRLGSTEGIKSYLLHSNCLAILSSHAIIKELKHKACRIIDIKGVSFERTFHFVRLHGQPSALAELFTNFAKKYRL